jgi:hypothetical protein
MFSDKILLEINEKNKRKILMKIINAQLLEAITQNFE